MDKKILYAIAIFMTLYSSFALGKIIGYRDATNSAVDAIKKARGKFCETEIYISPIPPDYR